MKILKYQGPWQFTLEDASMPAYGDSEILVRSEAIGICGSDVHGYTGESGRRKPGMVMGHEAAGTVVASGANVRGIKPGDNVAIFPTLGCGTCEYCKAGLEHICPSKRIMGVNAGTWGAMGDYFVCNERQAFPLNEHTDPAIGLFAEPLGVALHAVNLMKPRQEAVLAIIGAGTIGLALTIVLASQGYKHLFILDKIEAKLELARELGAHPIHAENDDALQIIARETNRSRPFGVFEAVGAAATVRRAYDLCDFGGTIVLIGNLAKEFTLPLQGVTSNELTIRGSYGFTRAEFGQGAELAERNQEVLSRLITGSCSLEDTPKVMEQLARGELQATKMVIRPQHAVAVA